jgi:hypothetical protein
MHIAITAMSRVDHLGLGACAIHLLATFAIYPHSLHAQAKLILSFIYARIAEPHQIELPGWD